MIKTNYQRISKIYDNNKLRKSAQPDEFINNIITQLRVPSFRFLDLACGTGNFISTQYNYFEEHDIKWFGLDSSIEMLERAEKKLPSTVNLIHGTAESMPYKDKFFDAVFCNFAFHHFTEKKQTIREIIRVIKTPGILSITNIEPFDMKGWWLYKYFPTAYRIDQKRFWSLKKLFHVLENGGLTVTCTTTKTLSKITLEEIREQAGPRDISELDLLPDKEFQKGLKQIESDLIKGINHYLNESAIVRVIAWKEIT